jgi:carbamoyl-phosphate synthase large subunit
MNVLILSASRKVSLVQAFQKALAEEGGGKVLAADAGPLAPALYLADGYALVPRSDDPRFLDETLELCERRQISLLVPTRDEELPLFAEQRERFARHGITVMVSSPEAVRVCQDKRAFLGACREHGLSCPVTYEGRPPQDAFPVFVKPRSGKSSHGVRRVSSAGELAALLQEQPDLLVQECLPWPEYTIDAFADFSGRVVSVVPRERILVVAGESYVSRTRKAPQLIEEGARLVRALGLIGHVTIQCFYDGRTVKFIEVNPRFGGAANLGFAAGVPTPRFLVRLLLGRPVEPCIGEFRDRHLMLRYTQDIFLDAAQTESV